MNPGALLPSPLFLTSASNVDPFRRAWALLGSELAHAVFSSPPIAAMAIVPSGLTDRGALAVSWDRHPRSSSRVRSEPMIFAQMENPRAMFGSKDEC